jgi:hypothetical protein
MQKVVGKTDGCIECGKVFTGLKMCDELRGCVRDYYHLKKDATSWSSQQVTT